MAVRGAQGTEVAVFEVVIGGVPAGTTRRGQPMVNHRRRRRPQAWRGRGEPVSDRVPHRATVGAAAAVPVDRMRTRCSGRGGRPGGHTCLVRLRELLGRCPTAAHVLRRRFPTVGAFIAAG